MTRGNVAVLTGLALLLGSLASANRKEAVEQVVTDAYVNGVHRNQDVAAMRKGFHPDFKMLMLREGKLQAVTLAEWAARVEKSAEDQNRAHPEIVAKFTRIDVVGTAASVGIEIHRDGRHVWTDYLSLYEFPDGWKIVAKTFYSHPKD